MARCPNTRAGPAWLPTGSLQVSGHFEPNGRPEGGHNPIKTAPFAAIPHPHPNMRPTVTVGTVITGRDRPGEFRPAPLVAAGVVGGRLGLACGWCPVRSPGRVCRKVR